MNDPGEHSINPEDPLPALIAELDQAVATAPHLARAAFGCYAAFLEQGFSESQAVYLVAAQITDNDLDTP